jgi:hypothetical protein
MKNALVASLVLSVFFSIEILGQSSNATVSGTVADSSDAVVPGVTITATNNATGVVTSVVSNDAGAYSIVGLLPGSYTISGSLPGFQTQTYSNVQLGNAAQVRLNFTLQVSGVAQSVEVTIAAENLITSSSSSVGEVLPQRQVEDLPLVSNNVLDLVGVMAGVFMTNDAVFGAEQTNFAGVSARDVNVQRDGVSLNSQRWPNGLDAPTRMNPDLVGEIRLILAPVDAEMGRGNGQVQIQTRSGTNAFHGSAVWNVQNSALDSNLWSNNRAVPRITPQWRNLHDYSVAFGGPIKQNKSFFYVLWNQQIALQRRTAFPTVLTDCARLGIFRYYDNYNNGSANQIPTGGGTPTVPVVDVSGNPVSPDGSPLRYLSVFGPLAADPTTNDCSDAQINTTTLAPTGATSSWDPNRTQLDTTGYMRTNLDVMPRANAFDNPANLVATSGFFATYAPDGLNTATARWIQHAKGADNLFGVGQDNNRRQINVKLDHNFNDRHKISGSYSYEIDTSDDAALPLWPGIPNGLDIRKPQVLAVNFISTLSSSLVNEARFGHARSGANTGGVLDRDDVGAEWLAKLPQINGLPLSTNVGFQNMAFGFGYAGSLQYASHEVSPRWSYADTVSWTRGTHSFKFGGEYRSARTKSRNGGSVQTGSLRPTAAIGNAALAPVGGIARPGLAGSPGAFGSGNTVIAENLVTWLAGSLSSLSQVRFINELEPQWADPLTNPFKIRDIYQNEIGTFFKDDWKISRRLTLNLGLRWDYYGVPWEKNGLTTGLTDGGMALFGLSGRSFDDWMKPGVRGDLSEIIYVGPNSPNPDQRIYKKEWNNFGPAVGFAWQLPWFGEGKTTVRGGYQLQYLGGGRGFVLDTAIGNPPGSSNTASYIIPASDPYFSIEKLYAMPSLIPVAPTFLPSPTSTIIPVTDRTGLMNAFDPNFLSPYVQNLTLSVTRNMTQKVTLDFKYIGTLTRKLWTNLDLNAPNFLFNGLKEAFDAARMGGESPLLDRLFQGLTITGPFDTCRVSTPGSATVGPTTPCGPVGQTNSAGVLVTGAMALRAYSGTRSNLANGNYGGLATTLNTLTNAGAGTPGFSGSLSGSVLRHANSLYPGEFPENFIKANPQMSTAVLESNLGHANYHSFQSQVSLRPTGGVSVQATYTYSRNLGQTPGEGPNGTGATYTEPYNRGADYTLLANHRAHTLVTYGSFALPIGPGKSVFGNTSGFWARLAENWQASWIVNLASGAPSTVSANSMLYGLGVPDVVGPFNGKDYVKSWANGARSGNVFSDGDGNALYSKVRDPQCLDRNLVNADLGAAGVCTLNGIADSSGQVVLQTPLPGTRGSLGQRTVEGLGTWSADMAVQKRISISESKSITVRLDATNVFNHPTPAIGGGFFAATAGVPDLNLQSAVPFGDLNSKVGNREFQLKARLDF